jgi:hypothetical protein
MRHLSKALGLLLLLITAQQGAVVHEVSHCAATIAGAAIAGANSVDMRSDSGGAAKADCALCPAFAQVFTPAFSHSFHPPLSLRADVQRSPEPAYEAVESAVATPRSRGPPASI